MKIQLALFITLLRLFVSIPQASSGVCPVLACSSQVSSTTCIQPVSPPSIYTFFNCASGGYSCGVLAADGDYFLDVPSGSQTITERDCALSSEDGSPCTSNIDCTTLNCQNNVCVSGIKAENEYCGNSSQCAGDSLNCLGQVLNNPVSICVPLLQEGLGPCTTSADCVDGLWCDSSATKLCLQKRAYSKTCTLDQQCQLGYCERKACRPDLTLMGVGGPCTTVSNCKSGLVCLDLKKNTNSEFGQDGSPDTCGNKLADTGVGCLQDTDCATGICVDLVNVNTGAADSPDGLHADTCQAAHIPYKGKGCLIDSHCDNASSSSASYCDKNVTPFLCNYKQMTGTACQADYYCLSNICVNSLCVSQICNQHTDCPADLNGVAQYCDLDATTPTGTYMCNPKIAAAVLGTDPAIYEGIECAKSYQCQDNHYCDTTITAQTPTAVCKPADAATSAACLDDAQCSTAGDICLSGTCQASKCRSNADCTNQYCDLNDNTCKAFFAQGAACTDDLQCDTSTHFCDTAANSPTCIQKLAILSTCDRNAQCSGTKICLNTQCDEFKCVSDNDCLADQFCNTSKNLCLKDYTKNVGDVCETDKYCHAPNQCLEVTLQNGSKQLQCRSESCSQDSHCKADPTAQYCDLTNKYCKFRTDRNDPCTTNNECSSTDTTDICFWNNCVALPTCTSGYFYNADLQACIAQKADGQSCDRNQGCTSGLCVSSTCTTLKSDGEQCPLMNNDQCQNVCIYQVSSSLYKCATQITVSSTAQQCNEDADCAGYDTSQAKCIILTGNTLGFCKPFPQAGDNCTADPECPTEHTCIGTDVCQQYTEQRCTRDLDCQTGQLCYDYDYDVTIEQGGDKCIIPLTTQFTHCLKQEHCPTATHYCDLADATTFTYRQCITQKADAAACLANYECASSYCIGAVCVASPAADGATCDEDADCTTSSWCSSTQCKAKVASGGSCTLGTDKCLVSSQQCLALDNSGSNFSCSVLHVATQYCAANSDCESTLYCNSNSQCELRLADYATCSNTLLCDQNNYKCESVSTINKCIAPLTSGSCSNDATCASGYFCSSANQCTAYITTNGQTCAGADQRCWSTHFCSSSNTCLQKYTKEIGEQADNDLECKSGKSIFSRCVRVKVVSQRTTLNYPYQCTVGYTCEYISDDAAQFDLAVKDCICSGLGSSLGFCPIVQGTQEYEVYTSAYFDGNQISPSTTAVKQLNRIVYEQSRHALLQNCEVRDCLQTVDPNWPTALTAVNELTTVCTVSSTQDSGTALTLSWLVLMSALLLFAS